MKKHILPIINVKDIFEFLKISNANKLDLDECKKSSYIFKLKK